ncbi:hypothetical protein PSP31120_00770 [Pandoraea sputorum]|nr:hypothetical protein PSP31120_00770 [Pandoraea sputorum]
MGATASDMNCRNCEVRQDKTPVREWGATGVVLQRET